MNNPKCFFKLSKVLLTGILLVSCFYFLFTKTQASFESNLDGSVDSKIAKWKINLNSENITDEYDKTININDIDWEASHIEEGYVGPTSTGVFTIEIDPKDTDIAFKYDIEFTDKSIDDNYVLTLTSISSSDSYLVKTNENTYTGLFSLDDIKDGEKKVITINLSWLNNDDNNEFDTNISNTEDIVNFIDLKFRAIQYNGEDIIEYNP